MSTINARILEFDQFYPYIEQKNASITVTTVKFLHVGLGDEFDQMTKFLNQLSDAMEVERGGHITITLASPSEDEDGDYDA